MNVMLTRFLPIVTQLAAYRKADLQGDLSAGLTVGVMLIPQGMAYALIAGLPPIYGLYASLVPLIIYALFGTSRQLAVGPVAMVSLLVAAGVAPLADGDPARYITLALTLSLMVGVIQLALGLLRFGFLTNFLSHPVLAGFTSAAALIIGASQLRHLLGVDLPGTNYVHVILWAAINSISEIHITTFTLGMVGILLLIGLRRWKKAFPGALVVVVLATLVSWLFDLSETGLRIVGEVPRGLPAPVMPLAGMEEIMALLPAALTISLVGFMESIAVAKVYASRNKYAINPDQELIGLGLANIAGAIFRSYPTTGGFSRTAVNAEAGARTNVAAIFSAVIIGLTLLFLTPLFFYLPQAVLAAIVMVAVAGLFEWKEFKYLWRVDKRDFGMLALTFVATLALGIEEGILAGVVASLVLALYRTSKPHVAVMGQLPGSTTFRNLSRHPEAVSSDEVVIFRMDAELFFANASYFKDQVDALTEARPRVLIIDAYPINRIDSTGIHALQEVVEMVRERGVSIYLAGIKGPVMDMLKATAVDEMIGRDRFFYEVHEAATAAGITAAGEGEYRLQPSA